MKTMVIGISPNYNYPGQFDKWIQDNTYYASNHGGSLITRALLKQFNADYIDDFSDIPYLKNKYDVCIVALATHAHNKRDITKYVNLIEQLEMKVIVISLGVSDYIEDSSYYELHASVKRLLHLAQESSQWIGVRGPYTASILMKNGFKNVVPIGCPTLFWNMDPNFNINLKDSYSKPLVVYHKTLMNINYNLIRNLPLLGQDYQDQAIFTNSLHSDEKLQKSERDYYGNFEYELDAYKVIQKRGIFFFDFDSWFEKIGQHDFVFGPRLHGCIAALIQGIPAVLLPRDLRVREIAEVFNLPTLDYKDLSNKSLNDIEQLIDFSKFKETFRQRFNNYCAFIKENNISSNLSLLNDNSYKFLTKDIITTNYIQFSELSKYRRELSTLLTPNNDIKYLKLVKYIERNNIKRIAIFGTKETALETKSILEKYNYKTEMFLDNFNYGKNIDSVKVKHPKTIKNEDFDLIIITVLGKHYLEIIKQLKEYDEQAKILAITEL